MHIIFLSRTFQVERVWCSGIMADSHSVDPGSIPGARINDACETSFFFCCTAWVVRAFVLFSFACRRIGKRFFTPCCTVMGRAATSCERVHKHALVLHRASCSRRTLTSATGHSYKFSYIPRTLPHAAAPAVPAAPVACTPPPPLPPRHFQCARCASIVLNRSSSASLLAPA